MVESADTLDSKSSAERCVGSSPTIRIYDLSTLYIECAFIFYTHQHKLITENLKTHF